MRTDFLARHSPRHGSILLLVLVALVMMTLATGAYLVLMHNEHVATRNSGHHEQVRLLTESGIEYLRLFLAQTDDLIYDQGGWQNNPTQMQGVLVADDALADFRGRFTILAPDMAMGYYIGPRCGLENESSKLNLNTLIARGGGEEESDEARERLMALPGMTDATADAILDWFDEDDVPRALGAESSYYLGLDPAYEPRNGPISSLDELLMVRGVTTDLLYGMDSNRNYQVDASEISRGAMTLVDNYNGQMNRGWSAYLTLYSMERLETPAGERRINVNSRNLRQLYSDLTTAVGEPAAKFIVAYRQYPDQNENQGRTGGRGGEGGEDSGGDNNQAQNDEVEEVGQAADIGSLTIDFEKEAEREIDSLLDLVGARVTVQEEAQQGESSGEGSRAGESPGGGPLRGGARSGGPQAGGAPPRVYESPWKDEPGTYRQTFLDLLDVASAMRGRRVSGRVNINTAARPVLMTVPGMTDLVADQIISRRSPDLDPQTGYQRHAVWLLADSIVTKEQMQEMDPYVTADGDVFTCQIVGFFEAAPPQARVEVVLDASSRNTRLATWQDLTPLGPGFFRDVLWTGAAP